MKHDARKAIFLAEKKLLLLLTILTSVGSLRVSSNKKYLYLCTVESAIMRIFYARQYSPKVFLYNNYYNINLQFMQAICICNIFASVLILFNIPNIRKLQGDKTNLHTSLQLISQEEIYEHFFAVRRH